MQAITGTHSPPRAATSHSASEGSLISPPLGRRSRQRSVSQRQKASASYQFTPTTGWFGASKGTLNSSGPAAKRSSNWPLNSPFFHDPALAASGQKSLRL